MADKYKVDDKKYIITEPYIEDGREEVVKDLKYDGCTGISDKIFGFCLNPCCDAHDAGYRNDIDLTRKETDYLFFALMCEQVSRQAKSPAHQMLGYLVSFWRYFVVRYVTGWLFWRPNGNKSIYEKLKDYAQ